MWVDAINSACWVGWLSHAQIAELAGCTLKNMHKQPKTQVLVCGWERIWYISFTLFSLKVFNSIFRQIFCMMTNYRDGQDCSSRLKNELANIILRLCLGRQMSEFSFWHSGSLTTAWKGLFQSLAVLVQLCWEVFFSVNFGDKTGNWTLS